MSRSTYHVHTITPEIVFIVDDCLETQAMSVTNDAEAVCQEIHAHYPHKRIIYQDTDVYWDELVHDNGVFINFKPARNMKP